MNNEKKILLVGNIKSDGSKSMELVLREIKTGLSYVDSIEPETRFPSLFYKLFFYPIRIFFKRGYDIYHIIDHSYGHLAYFLPKKKIIITCNDLIPLVFKNKMSWWGRTSFNFYISGLKRAAKIIAISENTKRDLVKILRIPEEKIEVVYAKTNLTSFRPLKKRSELRKKYSFKNELILLSFGNGFYKNTGLILRALVSLRKKYPNIRLLKIGRFREDEKEFIKKKGLEDILISKTGLSDEEIVEMYNVADMLVFPSLYEGFGRPPLEAMSCGLPVITSNASSLPEVVGDAAVKINPNSVNELVDGVVRIIEDTSFRKGLVRKGLSQARKVEQIDSFGKLENIYNSINY